MTLNPIDSHCHLFGAKYAVEEAAAMGWAYVWGNYPHAESMKLTAGRGSTFSWDRLTDMVKWFFDLGAALSGYEDNRAHLIQPPARASAWMPARPCPASP